MSGAKEIRVKIGSIKNTQKITSAMEMVAASKMKKAQDTMAASQPYSHKIRDVISHIACANAEYTHPYMQVHDEVKRVGFVIVSSDRGLCGGLNSNLFRATLKTIKTYQDQDIAVDLCLIGRKAVSFFKKVGGNVVATADNVGDKPSLADLIGIMKTMLDKYDEDVIQTLYLCSNEFVNTMVQRPFVQQLLPLQKDETETGEQGHWDYIYEPDDARELLTLLLKRYIESQVYQAVIENIACFQAAQMVAMKSATENAGDLINELQLIYNKARQASITREISEIVGGADAID